MTTQSEEVKTKRSKPAPKLTEKSSGSANLKEYASLKKEFDKGMMPDRKKVALLGKLTGLYAENKTDVDEDLFLKEILTSDRDRGSLSTANESLLNGMENDECTEECRVKSDNAPTVYRLKMDMVCKYKYDKNIGRDKKGAITGRFLIYVPTIVEGRNQLTMSQARREAKGQDLDPNELPQDKTLYKRVALNHREFNAWFAHDDEELIGNTIEKDEFGF